METNSNRIKQFCFLLAAAGVAAPTLSQASTVDSAIAQVRTSRSMDRTSDANKQLLASTVEKFDKANDVAAVHANGHADGHADGHANLGSAPVLS